MSKIQEITGSACYLEEWMKTVKEIAEGFKVGFLSIGIRRVEEHVRGQQAFYCYSRIFQWCMCITLWKYKLIWTTTLSLCTCSGNSKHMVPWEYRAPEYRAGVWKRSFKRGTGDTWERRPSAVSCSLPFSCGAGVQGGGRCSKFCRWPVCRPAEQLFLRQINNLFWSSLTVSLHLPILFWNKTYSSKVQLIGKLYI